MQDNTSADGGSTRWPHLLVPRSWAPAAADEAPKAKLAAPELVPKEKAGGPDELPKPVEAGTGLLASAEPAATLSCRPTLAGLPPACARAMASVSAGEPDLAHDSCHQVSMVGEEPGRLEPRRRRPAMEAPVLVQPGSPTGRLPALLPQRRRRHRCPQRAWLRM